MENLEWCGYSMVKKLKMCLFVLTECTNVTDAQTDRHRMTSRGKKLGGFKNVIPTNVQKFFLNLKNVDKAG